MHRQRLIEALDAYHPRDGDDEAMRRRVRSFVTGSAECFDRRFGPGHITGAAWLLDADGKCVLLTHHRKLNRWLQLGGHSDGNPDVLDVAFREAREESGIASIIAISDAIFDLDVHRIPAYGNEPAHLHYDVRFLMQVVGDCRFRVSDESIDLAWVGRGDPLWMNVDASVHRMHDKWVDGFLDRCVRSESMRKKP